jgi:hypothetical protein
MNQAVKEWQGYQVGDKIEVLMPHWYLQWEEKYPLKEGASWIPGTVLEVSEGAMVYELPDVHVDRMMAFEQHLNEIRHRI